MRALIAVALAALLLAGCNALTGKKSTTTPGKSADSLDLKITPATSETVLEWGHSIDVPLDIVWKSGKKLAVQLSWSSENPVWLKADLQPAIVDPPARTTLQLSVDVGAGALGSEMLVLEASAYGMTEPMHLTIPFTLRRESGEFTPLLAGPVTIECRNVCGRIEGGQLAFYDVLKEKGQTCGDAQAFPESQRIGPLKFFITDRGFGYGRTCKVAGVFEANGNLSFVNLGLTSRLPRGAILLGLRSARDVWFSPDNTLALVRFGDAIGPYDVVTGQTLDNPCRLPGDFPGATLQGRTLTCGTCVWQLNE